MTDREKVIKDNAIRGLQSAIEIGGALVHLRKEHAKAILELIKAKDEQETIISNQKEVIENLLQQLQDNSKYMTPFGLVSDVRAYLEGRPQPEIVRCYACKFGEPWGDLIGCGNAKGFGIAHKPGWFCADGERNDNDGTY